MANRAAFILKMTNFALFNGVPGYPLGVPDGKPKRGVIGEAPINYYFSDNQSVQLLGQIPTFTESPPANGL